jgi:hypothetical protein
MITWLHDYHYIHDHIDIQPSPHLPLPPINCSATSTVGIYPSLSHSSQGGKKPGAAEGAIVPSRVPWVPPALHNPSPCCCRCSCCWGCSPLWGTPSSPPGAHLYLIVFYSLNHSHFDTFHRPVSINSIVNSVHDHSQDAYHILKNPILNKGSSYTAQERDALGLHGLIPGGEPLSLETKVEVAIEQLRKKSKS